MTTVALATDGSGFLSQECPTCTQRFKIAPGRGSDKPTSFCPYCGHHGEGCWWTPEQAEYLSAVAYEQVLRPQLDDMARRVNRGGGILTMSIDRSRRSTPRQPIEPADNWPTQHFRCCGEDVKLNGTLRTVFCTICGASANYSASISQSEGA